MKDIDTLGSTVAKLFGLEIVLQLGNAFFIAISPENGVFQPLNAVLDVAVGVGFLTWLRRTTVAAQARRKTRLGPGWAVGGWFTPILWFWIPCQVAVNAVRGICADDAAERRRLLGFVAAWWLLWLATFAAGIEVHRNGTGHLAEYDFLPFATIPSCLCAAAAAACAMVWVRRLTAARTAAGIGDPISALA